MSRPTAPVAVGVVLLGCATGLRSQMGMVAVANGLRTPGLPGPLRNRRVRVATAATAAGELVVDKLAAAPDRTAPLGLTARVVLGALSGGIVASATGERPAASAALGAGSAAAAAWFGLAGRRRLSRQLSPLTAALIEDAVAVGLAVSAVAVVSRPRRGRDGGAG